jgi:hypothetical protein
MRALMQSGLIEEEIGERYRMTPREVRQQIAAVEMMDSLYFPITDDRTDPDHRSKFSYFLEFHKNGKVAGHCESMPQLPERFARWVKEGRIDAGVRVRRLPKILSSAEATRLLEVVGFDAAEEYLEQREPREQELYALLVRVRTRLEQITVKELVELGGSMERKELLLALQAEVGRVLSAAPANG